MIDEPGHTTGTSVIPFNEERAMLKTVSAALLAVSVLAAPALAATTQKTTPAPAAKSASVGKPTQVKKSALNANAKMGRHHVRHSTHHRSHKKMATYKLHKSSKVAAKHMTHPAKRG
jgi:hypothetical protein